MLPTMQTAALSTGVTLPYVEQGDPAGVPVVFLHGYTDSWRTWELLLGELPVSIHAHVLTQRGHGDAERPAGGYGVEDLAADVAAFLDAVGLEAAVLCGHSNGSYTAQRFAVDRPERTLGVVLVAAFRSYRDNAAVGGLEQAVAVLEDPVDPEFVHAFQAGTASRPLPDGFLDAIVAESLKVPARVWRAALRGVLDAPVPTETGTIAAPTLILWGDEDTLCPRADQDALVAACPDARLEVYAGTGHSVQWDRPARVAADLAAFTAPLAAAPTRSRAA